MEAVLVVGAAAGVSAWMQTTTTAGPRVAGGLVVVSAVLLAVAEVLTERRIEQAQRIVEVETRFPDQGQPDQGRDLEVSIAELLTSRFTQTREKHAIVGREKEIQILREWLSRDTDRVRVLVGGGGVGKTHLADHMIVVARDHSWYCLRRHGQDVGPQDLAEIRLAHPNKRILLAVDYLPPGPSWRPWSATCAPDPASTCCSPPAPTRT